MSESAPGLAKLRDFASSNPGPQFFLGIVGDANHRSGYHLGPDRIRDASDYSIQLARDVAGKHKYPSYACGYDMGMGWARSRAWLAWLVDQCRKGAFPNVREIIGSLDGVHKQYWSALRGFRTERYDGDNHIDHTHISVYRDSAEDDHSDMLRRYLNGEVIQTVPPVFPGRLMRFTEGQATMKGDDVRMWQARMRERGWQIQVDGVYGPASKRVTAQFQQEKGLGVDGIVGPLTWAAAWTLPVT